MNPVGFAAIPLLPWAAKGASNAAASGAQFLQSLLGGSSQANQAASVSPTPAVAPQGDLPLATLQRNIGEVVSKAGLGDALPLQISDNGSGAIRVTSNHPQRAAIENLLNADATISSQFRELSRNASLSTGDLRFTVAPPPRFDASA